MAEIAIPLIALGSLYISSNKKCEKENFQIENNNNMSRAKREDYVNAVPQKKSHENQDTYLNPNDERSRYYDKNAIVEINKTEQNKPKKFEFISLTGETVNGENFKHNNMQPFFGSKIKGKSGHESHEGILDGLGGVGSQQFKKQERAPLFKPSGDSKFINGAPNMSEFYMSRVNPSLRQANTKPWEEEHVAPGLNGNSETEGMAGFNSGMGSRDIWKPKDVDDLRVKTNPKMSYNLNGLEGPAISNIKEMGTLGKVEKHAPDTFFINDKSRWFITNGGFLKETMHSQQPEGNATRSETTTDYSGIMSNGSGNGGAIYAPNNYQDALKQQLPGKSVLGGVHSNKNAGIDEDYGSNGFELVNNNRNTSKQPESTGFVNGGGLIGSIVSPLLDVLKPSRKENVLTNLRECGNFNGGNKASYLDNKRDSMPTTIRELNGNKMHLNVQSQGEGAYHVTEHQKVFNRRDTTNVANYGNMTGNKFMPSSQESSLNQHDNPYKESTMYNRFEHGCNGQFNNGINMRTQKFESDRNNNRMFIPSTGPVVPMGNGVTQTTKYPQTAGQDKNNRIDGNLLQAFKENPYTHSLSSAP